MSVDRWPDVQKAIDDGRIDKWLSEGCTEKSICACLGISVPTWERYKRVKPGFREFLKRGKKPAIEAVVNALYKKAIGYDYTETKTTVKTNPDGSVTETVETFTKHSQPDTGAAIMYLKNMDREHWQSEPKMIEVRKRELELKERVFKATGKVWDDDANDEGPVL